MNPEWVAAVQRAATVTFGAFSAKGLTDEIPDSGHEAPVAVAVGFTGPRKGRVEVCIWRPALGDLAASMYDQREPPPFSDQLDAIREVTNVIAGNVLRFVDPQSAFSLGLPKVQKEPAGDPGTPAALADFGLGSGKVSVRLFVD